MSRLNVLPRGSHHRAEKSWGYEIWVENNNEYCGKELHFTEVGGSTSMHFHVMKRETMYCVVGAFTIEYIDTNDGSCHDIILTEGSSVEIPRLTPHKISSLLPDSLLLEFSTPHEDQDSFRLSRTQGL